ncbi:molybdopterin synthase sulfur carrier subunit [Sphingobium sp. OAS761]|uniref:MoaD/ThiS family protein n=1 Tax=Sphingobium sp. OAS761 TaxID=2817901 RepID=UPI0020A0878C|nr:MoaD/ThiS family protein [Sphingobium sp. OAS761]MCP1470941.1 molybdopterin synthase sulfur carrier subunit [Sphingobium sp. OAS761]
MLSIVYFAWVREMIGRDGEALPRPAPETTIADVISALAARGDGYAAALGDQQRLRAALDQHFTPLDHAIGDAQELALFPPVTGG